MGARAVARAVARAALCRPTAVHLPVPAPRAVIPGATTAVIMAMPCRYAGHNKWSKIRHKKGDADTKRALQFSRLGREMIAAVKSGGGSIDPAVNNKLGALLTKARAINMPKASIDAALKKAQGPDASNLVAITYEGSALGTAFIVEAVTDNSNRTVKNIKAALTKVGGSMSSVVFMFLRKGVITVTAPADVASKDAAFEKVLDAALEAGAEDVQAANEDESEYAVLTEFTAMYQVSNALKERGLQVTSVEGSYIVNEDYTVTAEGEREVELGKLIDKLEEMDDVVRVYTNLE
ncbi:YebC/PmpR family DNA-binding regulatory protein [Allomyces macrogynus ATCC 38327]|uniref:YebC/PmpR family DNA-binding regulatory protein n=1 Tax=Allomyces macrogynus (strain ATCC 38327) TaxID=578462 RepID=A0A0L0T9G7_ALLM3|nr:YebC/PmpR family DNA-binding regulatory protein [Allomyces macrogynus ATCC 38327]|eukprot:KNE71448.1 YebC/PmpR family DNA-binding regulatory protein [Allomyces macrogynus ATCC 38327]